MPRNASGVYTLPPSNPVVTDTIIATSWANPTLSDIAQALTDSLTKTGVTTAAANQPMGGFRHLSVSEATALDQYVRASQAQSSALIKLTSVTMPVQDAYTASLILSPTSFTVGQLLIANFPSANLGPATLDINGSGVRDILRQDGNPLEAGDIVPGNPYLIIYDGAEWRMYLDVTLLSAADLISALGYVPVAQDGSIPMTGQLTVVSPPVAGTDAASKEYIDQAIGGINVGVLSFNTRTGAVTLLSTDVTGALTYTPLNKAGDTMTGALGMGNNNLQFAKKVYFNSEPADTVGGGGVNIDFSTGQKLKRTLSSNVTSSTFNFPGVGHYQLNLISGSFTFAFPAIGATWQWLNSTTAPTLNTGTYGGIVTIFWNGTMAIASYNKVGAA